VFNFRQKREVYACKFNSFSYFFLSDVPDGCTGASSA
jgi:hypothetical protein